MKKVHFIIALVIFIAVFGLSLASNFIHWDETPLEQTIFALPLALGMLFQLPFFPILAPIVGKSDFVGYELLHTLTPLLAAFLYSSLYLLPFWVSSKKIYSNS